MCLKKEVYCHSRFPFIVKRRAFTPARKAYPTHGKLRFTHNRGVSCSVSLLKFHIQFPFYTQQCSVPLYQIPLTSAYGPLPPHVVMGPPTCKEKNTSGLNLKVLTAVKHKSMRNALVLGPGRGNFPREILIETIAETGVRQNVVKRSSEIR